jgi:hypothetical protein
VLLGGLSRSLSPIRYQAHRGLQIESVAASPLMLARAFAPRTWRLRVSRFRAWEIYGPWVHAGLTAASLLSVLGLLVLAGLWWRAGHSHVVDVPLLGWMFFATALVVTVTDKALSPQYILWLGGTFAAVASRSAGRQVLRAGSMLLVIAVVTQVIFPIGYGLLTVRSVASIYPASLLVARNALLVWLTFLACHQVWRLSARSYVGQTKPRTRSELVEPGVTQHQPLAAGRAEVDLGLPVLPTAAPIDDRAQAQVSCVTRSPTSRSGMARLPTPPRRPPRARRLAASDSCADGRRRPMSAERYPWSAYRRPLSP